MKKYKLMTQDMTTYYDKMKWELNKTNHATGEGNELCSEGVLHYYDSPELAVLLNPIHAAIDDPRLFEIECDSVAHDGCKGGSKWQRPVKELELPVFTIEMRIKFAILCAREVYKEESFIEWSDNWLSGKDRSVNAAWVARAAAWAAAWAAVDIQAIAEKVYREGDKV